MMYANTHRHYIYITNMIWQSNNLLGYKRLIEDSVESGFHKVYFCL